MNIVLQFNYYYLKTSYFVDLYCCFWSEKQFSTQTHEKQALVGQLCLKRPSVYADGNEQMSTKFLTNWISLLHHYWRVCWSKVRQVCVRACVRVCVYVTIMHHQTGWGSPILKRLSLLAGLVFFIFLLLIWFPLDSNDLRLDTGGQCSNAILSFLYKASENCMIPMQLWSTFIFYSDSFVVILCSSKTEDHNGQ